MNRSKLWIILVVVLLLVNTAVLIMFWFKKAPNGPLPGGQAKDFLIKELNLTTEQQKQFDGLREEHQRQVRAALEGMRELKDALIEEIAKPTADSAAIDSISKAINNKERKRELATVYHFRAFRGILTADQQSKFDKILKDVLRMMNAGGQRPQRQGPPPGGGRGERGDGPPDDSAGDRPPPPGADGPGPEPH